MKSSNQRSLRGNKDLLHKLKRQLDILWGDLEEQKSAKQTAENPLDPPPSTFNSIASSPPPTHEAGDQPDADDSDVENVHSYERSSKKCTNESALHDRGPNSMATIVQPAEAAPNQEGDGKLAPRNKPFTCCIRQYGVKLKEKDPSKANTVTGERWQRMFGLFDTFIV